MRGYCQRNFAFGPYFHVFRTLRIFFSCLAYAALAGTLFALGSALLSPLCRDLIESQAGYDVIVVLGGGGMENGALMADTASRVDAGVALFQSGIAPAMHMTGGVNRPVPFAPTAEVMKDRAIATGVPADTITTEGLSRSTLENALFSKGDLDGKSLIIVTEGYHLWRSWLSFYWAGMQPEGMCKPHAFHAEGWQRSARATVREALALWFNLARAVLWKVADLFGYPHVLGSYFLH